MPRNKKMKIVKRGDCPLVPIRDVEKYVGQQVNLIAVISDCSIPNKSRGSDYHCCLRLIDETHQQPAFSVNIFEDKVERLPYLNDVGDIIVLCCVQVKSYGSLLKDVNVVYYKNSSSFALYEGKDEDDFDYYQVSSHFQSTNEDQIIIHELRKWRANFQFHGDLSMFPMLREIKEGNSVNLVCKIISCLEAAKDKWLILAWDGTNAPANDICSELENELESPLPLQLEPEPLSRELLCTLPVFGSILRITFVQSVENYTHLLNVGKWVKFMNVRLEVVGGLWHAVFTPQSKLRYTPNEDNLFVDRQRLSDERLFPDPSFITEVNQDHGTLSTLMTVLTHSEGTSKFKCIIRVVAATPCQAKDLISTGRYRLRLTLEDSTTRIHAFVIDKDGETLFDGYPSNDELTRKLNRLLGVNGGVQGEGAPRNPPWVCVSLKSFWVSKPDVNGVPVASCHFKIFDTKIVGDT